MNHGIVGNATGNGLGIVSTVHIVRSLTGSVKGILGSVLGTV